MLSAQFGAVHRARAILRAMEDEDAYKAFIANAVYCKNWDNPVDDGTFKKWQEIEKM